MKGLLSAFIIAFLLVIGAAAVCQAADREVLLGTVQKDTVLVVPKIIVKRPKDDAPVTVLQGSLEVEPGKAYTPKRYEFKQGVLCNQPYQWRVVRNMFWGSGSTGARQFSDHVKRIPLEDLSFYDRSNAKRDEQYHAKYPEDDVFEGKYRMVHSWGADPVGLVCHQHPLAAGDGVHWPLPGEPFHPTLGVFFDVYPTADNNRLQLFILDDDKMRIWNGAAKRGKTFYWNMDWGNEEKEIESFKSPFLRSVPQCSRNARIVRSTLFRNVNSGSVYLARPPAKMEDERKVEKVWDSKQKPVHALITDASNDKVYCFIEPANKDKQDEDRCPTSS